MTTPVFTRRNQSDGEKMEMVTPVITKKVRPCLVGRKFSVFCIQTFRK